MSKIGESSKALSELSDVYDDRNFKRGEIYYLDLSDAVYASSYVTNKTRPALIIQNDIGNLHSPTTIVALLTTHIKKPYPFQYFFNLNGRDSAIMFEQIMTVDKFRILEKCGELNAKQIKEAEDNLMYSLALNRLSLENVSGISVNSVVSKLTRTGQYIYFEIEIHFENNVNKIIQITLDNLRLFDDTITENSTLDDLEKKLDCCRGLHWLAKYNDI